MTSKPPVIRVEDIAAEYEIPSEVARRIYSRLDITELDGEYVVGREAVRKAIAETPAAWRAKPTLTPNVITSRGSKAFVYVFKADHAVKVGITIQSAKERCADLERASGLRIEVVGVFPCGSRGEAYGIEQHAHRLLEDSRTIGEWFACSPADALNAVRRAAGIA